MPFFKFNTYETRTYDVVYVVHAADYQAALNKVAIGDTVLEEDEKLKEVVSRDIFEDHGEVPDPF